MAPASEYVSGGGKLKIKGAPVLDGRVGKKGKKKRKKEKEKEKEGGNGSNDEERDGGSTRPRMKSVEGEGESATAAPDGDGGGSRSGSRSVSRGVSEGVEKVVVGKTEAERRYEEARRKRVCVISDSFSILFPLISSGDEELHTAVNIIIPLKHAS